MSAWVLVIGGASPLAMAAARAAGEAGFSIALHHDGDDAPALALCAELRARHINAVTIEADLSDWEATGTLAARACDIAGAPMAHLINAAAFKGADTLETFTAAQFERHMHTNLLAPAVLAQAFAGALPSDARGSIVSILDFAPAYPGADHFTYTLAAQALANATELMARALAPRVRVNAIALSPLTWIATRENLTDPLAMLTPPGWSPPDAREVSEAVVFLLQSQAITGQILSLEARAD